MENRKIWTYAEALEMFPVVKDITEDYHSMVTEIEDEIKNLIMPEIDMEHLEDDVRKLKYEWANEITRLEIDVKGLWLVDFDNGHGYYCWKIGEKELMYEHSYEEGFAGRKPINRKNDYDPD